MGIDFKKDGQFLNGKIDAGIEAKIDEASAIGKSILQNTKLPDDAVIDLQGSLSSKTGDINFGGGSSSGSSKRTVSFKAGVSGGILLTKSATDLQKKLTSDADTLAALVIPNSGVARFGALRWGYDIAGASKGSVGLGTGGAIKFGVEASSSGEFVVARAFAQDPTGADAINALLKAWRLPSQVSSPDDIEPGTWIAAEVDGEFAASIGAQFGYDYSWIRKVNAAGLSGDIGLKIQAAAAVTVGFNAAGKYLLIVARESVNPADRKLRVRISKLNRKGWDFALDASVNVTPTTGTFLPAQMDDFLRAVLGVHGPQLVKDLQTFRDWVNPATPLPTKFAGFVSQYATNKLNTIAGDQLAAARAQIVGVLTAWDQLPAGISSLIWDQIRAVSHETGGLSEIEPWLRGIASSDSTAIKEQIRKALGSPAFFSTPIGGWLNKALDGKLLDAALKTSAATTVKDLAKKTLAVLDGGVLQELVDFVNKKLNIDKFKQAVQLTDPGELEPWLAAKLSDFLGAKLDLKGLEQVRKTLFTLLTKAQDLYSAALESLNKTYGFAFHFEYARTTTKTALFDAEFDFAANPALGPFVRAAIDGDWTSMLLHPLPGMTLRGAVLTHGIQRSSAVEVTLPYFNGRIEKFNESLAKLTVVNDDGRLLLYDLKATDSVRARNKWQSALTVTGKVTASAAGVRNFSSADEADEAFHYSYSFRVAARAVRTMQLENRIQPLVKDLFPNAFAETSLHEWSLDLDKAADDVEKQSGGIVNGSGSLGDVLAQLEVVAPGRAVAAWLKAPPKGSPVYAKLSENIQTQLRRLIPLVFFTDLSVYNDSKVSAPFLVYPCLPILNNPKKGFYGDIDDPGIKSLLNNADTRVRFGAALGKVHAMLVDAGHKKASLYDPLDSSAMASILSDAANSQIFKGMLFAESQAVSRSINAALELAAFTADAGKDPEQALEALANFGENLTETFNSKLSTIPGSTMRQLGTVLFLEASRAFDPELAQVRPAARLVITLLRNARDNGNASAIKAYVNDAQEPDAKVIAIQQPVVAF